MPINESGSDAFWVNDTIEVFRVCPEYGPQSSSETITIIGRNFRDSDLLACRFTPCTGTAAGPLKCGSLGSGAISNNQKSIQVAGTYIGPTRVECPAPMYRFPSNESLKLLNDVCEYDAAGALAYVQSCDADEYCEDEPGTGQRFVYDTLVRAWWLISPETQLLLHAAST